MMIIDTDNCPDERQRDNSFSWSFYEVFTKPHPSGSRRFTPILSRLRLGLPVFNGIEFAK
jgi:hypothetical protein